MLNTATSLAEAQSKPADVNYRDRLLAASTLAARLTDRVATAARQLVADLDQLTTADRTRGQTSL